MSHTKSFHLGDILSITTGRLVSPTLMDGVYAILNHMTGESLFTHALIRASRVCKPVLLEQHPDLAAVDAESVTGENWTHWLAEQVQRFGERRDVVALQSYESKDPITELIEMGVPEERIITVIQEDAR